MNWTKQHIEELQKQGRIKGFRLHSNNPNNPTVKAAKQNNSRNKAKKWLSWNIPFWCNENSLTLETEYKFHPQRNWRFDWAIPALKIAIEYNGIISNKSRHTTITGYSNDMEKINAAQLLGWVVLQYTPLNYQNIINDLNKAKENLN